ncbi:leucine rich repeat protein [Ichthyophthirius multifiliis]|uniref:Leucine rich repeat protein n=1 Tax=Ichthyophthirius multifiliis TaxID=5932 RepID=G0QUH0_ICHMU|nr:leucine rich repeat protein [Ichthyophthirius multifiliis]EGR31140.1 leucine rich repeat protein [Ichthyophthirius multifiliis]|eukprot:XP_004034626.1 leucine rich repeat protein [Ichthyophthirius multifiliis]
MKQLLDQTQISKEYNLETTDQSISNIYITNQKKNESFWTEKFNLLQFRNQYKQLQSKNILQTTLEQEKQGFKKHVYQWGGDKPQSSLNKGYLGKLNEKLRSEEEEKQENDYINNMQSTFEIHKYDNYPKPILGQNSEEIYYKNYKKIEKISEQNKYFQIQDSTQTSILKEIEKQKLLPCKLGIIKSKGENTDIKINNMHYGDKYAKVISQGIKQIQSITNFTLGKNRISKKGADDLLQIIARKATILDLEGNQISYIGCDHIGRALEARECKIEVLNLEDNKLGDKAINMILQSVLNNINNSLITLNISKNYISDKCTNSIVNVIEGSLSLREFYLHWNLLKGISGQLIFQTLSLNHSLKVLDLSCNSLGLGLSFSLEICTFFTNNKDLRHLDLSNNYIDFENSKKIAEGLEKNKTIYGLHYSGNTGYIDSRGFLVLEDNLNEDLTGMHIKQRINSCKVLPFNYSFKGQREKDLKDVCWICGGWDELEIEIEEKDKEDPVFIYFNFENYKQNYLGKNNFVYKRMLPPTQNLSFFFTQEDDPFINQKNVNQITTNPEGNIIQNIEIYDNSIINSLQIEKLNTLKIHKKQALLDENYLPLITILPRTRDPQYVPAKQKKTKAKWTFSISLMAKWRPDDEELIKKCFETDWENSKIPQKVKKQEDQDLLKAFLRQKYQKIKDLYKYFASFNPIQDVWCIQNGPWLELVDLMKIIDQKIKDADLNLKWTATISGGEKGNFRNPERGINRHQLMEAFVRIAEEKYILKYSKTQSFFEAMNLFWDEHLENIINEEKYNAQKWREEKYWNEECDYCLKNYKKIIDHVYKKFSKLKVKPGQIPFMSLDELQKIISLTAIAEDENFGTNVVNFAYNQSMMTQIDELQSDRIFQMSQVEFYEAIARIAEEASLPVGPGTVEEGFQWSWEKRKQQKLSHKFEGLILRMLNTVCDQQFKAGYTKVEKSMFCQDDDEEYQ